MVGTGVGAMASLWGLLLRIVLFLTRTRFWQMMVLACVANSTFALRSVSDEGLEHHGLTTVDCDFKIDIACRVPSYQSFHCTANVAKKFVTFDPFIEVSTVYADEDGDDVRVLRDEIISTRSARKVGARGTLTEQLRRRQNQDTHKSLAFAVSPALRLRFELDPSKIPWDVMYWKSRCVSHLLSTES